MREETNLQQLFIIYLAKEGQTESCCLNETISPPLIFIYCLLYSSSPKLPCGIGVCSAASAPACTAVQTSTAGMGRGGGGMSDTSFDTITDLADKENVKIYLKHLIPCHVGDY